MEENDKESEDEDWRLLCHYAPVDDCITTGGIGADGKLPVYATDFDALYWESIGVDAQDIWDGLARLGTGFQYRWQYTFRILRTESDAASIADTGAASVFEIHRAIAPEDIVSVGRIIDRQTP